MRKIFAAGGCAALLAVGLVAWAAEDAPAPPMPMPQAEHAWLQQLVGDWDTEVECVMAPGQPAVKSKGTEHSRMIGGFWAVFENHGEMMGAPFTGIMTVGYDPEKKQYQATWVDSMTPILWVYQGEVDASGKALVLHAKGPSCEQPGKTVNYRETTTLVDGDHKVFTSEAEMDGAWVPCVTVHYTRKK